MLRQSIEKTKTAAGGLNKRKYFDALRGPTPAQRHIERSQYDLGTSLNQGISAELNEGIIAQYHSVPSDTRKAWMKQLTKEALEFIADVRGLRLQALREERQYQQAMEMLITAVFYQLQAYAHEFNQIVGWSELRVTATAPAVVTEVLKYNKFREPTETVTRFRARFSTRHISLVIRGIGTTVEFLLLPVEKVIGLSKAETNFEPVCRLTGRLVDQQIEWSLDGQKISVEAFNELSESLFTSLIDQTRMESRSSLVA